MADQSSYLTKYVGSQDLEPYIHRPKLVYNNTNAGLKRLVASADVHFDRATVNYIGHILTPNSTLSSWSVHTTSSNSAYAFAVGQIMLTRNILSSLPITPTSSMTAFNVIFRQTLTAQDITNDPRLGLGKIGIIALKKEKYGDFIRANSFSAITTNQLFFKDACSASQLHGVVVQEGPGYIDLTGAANNYWQTTDAGVVYGSKIMNLDGDNEANALVLTIAPGSPVTSGGWISYPNPSPIWLRVTNGGYGAGWMLSSNNIAYSGVGTTAASTATRLFCSFVYGYTNGVGADIASVIQTPSTSITTNITSLGSGQRNQVINFTTPTSGTVTGWFMCKNSASSLVVDIQIREAIDSTIHFWSRGVPTDATAGSYIAKNVDPTSVGWNIRRVNGGGLANDRFGWNLHDDLANNPLELLSFNPSLDARGSANNNTWRLLTASFSRFSGLNLYIDGVFQAAGTSPWPLGNTNNTTNLTIGSGNGGLINSNIGELLWVKKYAATQADATDAFVHGLPTGYANADTVAHYYWLGDGQSTNFMSNLSYVNGASNTHFGLGTYPSQFNNLSAGFIYYDLGVVAIHGPSTGAIDSISSISAVDYISSIKMTTLAAFCSTQTREFNYSTNDSAFYKPAVTSDPNYESTTALDNFIASGFQWGQWPATASHSLYYLRDTQNRTPYITTVGLYNEANELLLVGKMAQPIRKPKNIPLTIKVQYDF